MLNTESKISIERAICALEDAWDVVHDIAEVDTYTECALARISDCIEILLCLEDS